MMRRRIPALLFFALAACSGGDDDPMTPRDGGTRDTGPTETPRDGGPRDGGVIDSGLPPDAGVLFSESSCAACDTGCPGGMCLNTQTESFCADACGDDLDGCIDGYTCFDIAQGMGAPQYFCVPPGATCEEPATNHGTSCYGDVSACGPGMDWCEGDYFALGYCTTSCAGGSACPPGYTCGVGDDFITPTCIATQLAGAEYCGRRNDLELTETPCTLDRECMQGLVCVKSEPSLPGVCAPPCGAGCDPDKTCRTTQRGDVCLSRDCACHGETVPEGTRNLMAEALANVDMTRCSAIWDTFAFANLPKDLLLDPYRLSWFDDVHNEPLRGPDFAKGVVRDLDAAAEDDGMAPPRRAARMVERLADLIDFPANGSAPGMLDPVEPLTEAMVDLINATGGNPDRAAILADAADVPMDLQLALAEVLDAIRRADAKQKLAVPNANNRNNLYDFGAAFIAPRADRFGLNVATPNTQRLLNEDIPYGELYGAQVDLLDAIGMAALHRFAATPSTTATAAATYVFVQDTPIGRVAISDGENGVHTDDAPDGWALLVDLGGDDLYRVPAGGNVNATNSVSVLIDLSGDDRYGYVEVPHPLDDMRLVSDAGGRYTPTAGPDEDNGPTSFSETPRQGGGRMGTATLVDLGGGDDEYRSLRLSQGTGVFGTGVLVDDDGDDLYLGEAAMQGAAAFGIGLLFDGGGNDERRAYQFAQGFAYARAAGAVYDVAGDDFYFLDPGDPDAGGDPLYYSAQRPGRANSSLGQGFAFGRRADFTDRAFMSGGVGILVDASGSDRYDGSIFAQGGGFWFGTGILADHEGDDAYDALWYAMGTGAHYALGFLLEGAGNDTYGGALPRVNVTIAGAHDYTAAFLIDESGDDVYNGSRITLGAGNVNGIGFFVDNAGDDEYRPRTAYGVGNAALSENTDAGNARRKVRSVGVFIDAGGTDLYEVNGMPPEANLGNDQTWRQAQNMDPAINRNERGSGVDGVGESTLHAR